VVVATSQVSSQQLERERLAALLAQALLTDDFPLFARHFLKIRNKLGMLVPMVLWPHQEQCWADLKELERTGRPLWRLILKYRQGGFSRYFLAETLFVALRNAHWNILIIAHKKKLPTRFLNDIRDYIKRMPVSCRPELAIDSTTEIQFTEEFGGSRVSIASANTAMEGGGLEIGETVQRIHISEASDPVFKERPLIELFQTVSAGCQVIVESTAKGIGNYFYNTWRRAVAGKSKFTPRFVSWLVQPEYSDDVPMDFRPDKEELTLMNDYGLTTGQVVWRSKKIEEEMNGDTAKFKEQYPLTDIEAFLFTGSSLFSLPKLAHFLESEEFCKDWTTETGSLVEDATGELSFVKSNYGSLSVFRRPEEGVTYCVSGDVADGLEDGDYSVAEVFRGDTMEQCAEWRGHVPPRDFAFILANIGRWYNEALTAPEDNNMGSTTCDVLFETISYPNLYYRERPGPAGTISFKRIGWHTGANKPSMVERLAHHIRDHKQTGFRPHSKVLVDECRTFAANLDKQGKDRYAAQPGSFDDTVMATCVNLGVIDSWQYVDIPTDGTESFHQMAVDAGVVPDTKVICAWDEEPTEEDDALRNWCHR